MGFLDRLLSVEQDSHQPQAHTAPAARPALARTEDEALTRYRYMVRTAPPETLEQAHMKTTKSER